LPPEYCSFGQKDAQECKDWLEASHPVLFRELYAGAEAPKVAEKKAAEKKAAAVTGAEEGKETAEGEEGEEKPEKKEKKVKKVGFKKDEGIVRIFKQHRGGKKVVSQITGLEHYTKDLKGLASKLGKKFSCGASLAHDDIHGDCVSVQGDVEDRLIELLETDKDMMALMIPIEKVEFEDMGNKKGRKR